MTILLSFLAILLTGLSLVASGAHLAELPHKILMSRDDYMVVQGIYRGWSLFGVALIGAVLADLALAVAVWRQSLPCALAGIAGLLMIANLSIFFAWTFPVNQVTQNWTVAPDSWDVLRRQWEYSHAVNAVLTFAAFVLSTFAALTARR